MDKLLTNKTTNECVQAILKTIDPKSINIEYLIDVLGLSKVAVKELLTAVVDDYAVNVVSIESSELKEKFSEDLVTKYGLTYSLARKLLKQFDIKSPTELRYITDEILLSVPGIGEGTLEKIRRNFPYTLSSNGRIDLSSLEYPTKILRFLNDDNIYYVDQLRDNIEDIELGYPDKIILSSGYNMYCSDINTVSYDYIKEYIYIYLNSVKRNYGNAVRHATEGVNYHWLDLSIYGFITYIYEIRNRYSEFDIVTQVWPMLSEKRQVVLDELNHIKDKRTQEAIEAYGDLKDKLYCVASAIEDYIKSRNEYYE